MKLLHGTTRKVITKTISKMSLYQLQELATRQQEQIECTQRLLLNKEQRLQYLSNMQETRQRPLYDYDQHLMHFKEKISLQEAKLQKLRMLQGQIQKHRLANSNVCSELETLKLLFKEKERELSVAMNKIETLTRQLDEIKKNGNIGSNSVSAGCGVGGGFSNNNANFEHSMDLENLRQELLFKSKMLRQNEEELLYKRNILYKRKCDMLKVDQRINDLQSRLARKKQLNQQQQQQQQLLHNHHHHQQQNNVQQLSTSSPSSQNPNFFRTTENGNSYLMMMNTNNTNQQHHENSFISKTLLRNSIGHSAGKMILNNNSNSSNSNHPHRQQNPSSMSNVATVEPLPRYKIDHYDYSRCFDYGAKKLDPKYQTLPYNAKLGAKLKNINNNGLMMNQQAASSTKFSAEENGGSNNNNNNKQFMQRLHDCCDINDIVLKNDNNANGGGVGADSAKNDISLIINNNNHHPHHHQHHHHHGMKNNAAASNANNTNNNNNNNNDNSSLEERPSPSGSSGSSDRISSSLTTYSYNNEKSNFNDMKYGSNNHNNANNNNSISGSKDLSKSHYANNEEQNSLLFPHRFVPNSINASMMATAAATNLSSLPASANNETESSCDSNNSQKDKPSAPVKPIATTTTTTTTNLVNKNNFVESSNQQQDLFSNQDACAEENRSSDEVDDHGNHQRSSVSEIVNKLNNLTTQESWEKTKRRPVVSTNEMERELEKISSDHLINNNHGCDANDLEAGHKIDTLASSRIRGSTNKNTTPTTITSEDAINNNETPSDEIELRKDDDATINESATSAWNETNPKTFARRIKGSLKNKEQTNNNNNNNNNKPNKIGSTTRRVSFDPLALLLDASLEGELELVKKTANQVPNPSAANDEGITALHNATCAGHFEIVKYLVEIGCDVNVQDSDGWTPLHCAASCNNLTMIKFLVKSGACIFATTFSDHETAAEKCEEDEEGFDGCSQYLYGVQEKLGILNNGIVYALYDYESQNEDELSFHEGDALKVLQKGDDREKEWWWSSSLSAAKSNITAKEGYIPRNLIGLFARIKPKD